MLAALEDDEAEFDRTERAVAGGRDGELAKGGNPQPR